jgi:two-component system NtrC family sensor kinase
MPRVLLIEDSPTQACWLAGVLQGAGFEVDTSPDAAGAYERLAHDRFDLILSDLQLPGESGFDLCRRIKADSRLAATPVLILTAEADPANVLRGLEAGADGFMTKDRPAEAIVAGVRRVLDRVARGSPTSEDRSPTRVRFLGEEFELTAGREQLLGVLLSSFEDVVQLGRRYQASAAALAASNAQLEQRNGQLQQLSDELASLALSELQSKNQALERAGSEMRQTGELRDAFIRVASHELRTPLTILLGLCDLAVRAAPRPGEEATWLPGIRKATLRLAGLVEQMTRMLRAGRPALAGTPDRPLERRDVELASLVAEAVDEVRTFVQQRRQELELDVPPGLGTVRVEPDMIRDSLQHLLLNAIKFTPDGGRLRLGARRAPDGGCILEVQDSGVGIDAVRLPYVFEPFFTSFDVSRHRSGHFEFGRQGMGLGLALVKAFVELHGGTVAVASEPGRGSTFTITLPPA